MRPTSGTERTLTLRLRPLLLAVVAVIACHRAIVAGERGASPFDFPAQGSAPIYVGVLGEIGRPGVYQVCAAPTLDTFLRSVGGVTGASNGSVRVIRNGRVAQQVFLASKAELPLSAGDLVVVDRQRSFGALVRPAEMARAHRGSGSPSDVQIAFLNVIDRPVVVRMTVENATIARICELLGQPNEVAAKVRAIGPAGVGSRSADSPRALMRPLESGTALVFPIGLVQADSLPSLPESVDACEPAHDQSAASAAVAKDLARRPDPSTVPHRRQAPLPMTAMVAPELSGPVPTQIPSAATASANPSTTDPPAVSSLATNRPPVDSPQANTPTANMAPATTLPADMAPAQSRGLTAPASDPGALLAAEDSAGIRTRASRLFGLAAPISAGVSSIPLGAANVRVAVKSPAVKRQTRPLRTRGPFFLMLSIAVVAALALIATAGSIIWRGIQRVRRAVPAKTSAPPAATPIRFGAPPIAIPAAPVPSSICSAGRRLRIDARQPMTRLGVELSIVKRAGGVR